MLSPRQDDSMKMLRNEVREATVHLLFYSIAFFQSWVKVSSIRNKQMELIVRVSSIIQNLWKRIWRMYLLGENAISEAWGSRKNSENRILKEINNTIKTTKQCIIEHYTTLINNKDQNKLIYRSKVLCKKRVKWTDKAL